MPTPSLKSSLNANENRSCVPIRFYLLYNKVLSAALQGSLCCVTRFPLLLCRVKESPLKFCKVCNAYQVEGYIVIFLC